MSSKPPRYAVTVLVVLLWTGLGGVERLRAERAVMLEGAAIVTTVAVEKTAPKTTMPAALPAEEKQTGINFLGLCRGAHAKAADGVARDQKAYESLKETGAGWMSLNVASYQETIESTRIDLNASKAGPDGHEAFLTPSDEEIAFVVKRAHDDGVKVMLKPFVMPRTYLVDPNVWHGLIGTKFTTESQWAQWFSSYTAFIVHYARLCSGWKVEQLCIGTELQGTEGRTADWRNVIRAVRQEYRGPMVYASVYASAERVQWWDDLDYIGVDAYYPLTDKMNPSVGELRQGWRKYTDHLERLSNQWHRPILFTEIGYPSVEGANMQPWAMNVNGKADLEGQKNLYQAFFEEVYPQRWLHGVYWWVWYAQLAPPDGDRNYPPCGKPAEAVLKKWFKDGKR